MFRRTPVPTPDFARVPLLDGLTPRQLAAVDQLVTQVAVPAGTVLAQEGATGAEFFILLDGQVDVVRGAEVIATRGAGAHLGEIALLAARPRTATLVAATPIRTAVASRREFRALLHEVPSLSDRLASTMAERLAA